MSLFSGDEVQLQKILDETVDRVALPDLAGKLQTIIRTEVDNAASELSGMLKEATADLHGTTTAATDEAHALLDRLNGTTVTVDPITFKLNIPERKPAAVEPGNQGNENA